jgi:hypothetical protein
VETARKKLFAVGAVIEQYDSVSQTIQAERLKYEQLRRNPALGRSGEARVTPEQIMAGIVAMEGQLKNTEEILLYYTGKDSVEVARDAYAALVTSYNYFNKCRDAVSLIACGADATEELGLPNGTTAAVVAEKFAVARAAVIAAGDDIALPAISTVQLH